MTLKRFFYIVLNNIHKGLYKTMNKTKRNRGLAAAYFILRAFVVVVMVRQAWIGNYTNVMLCALTLILFMIPSFVEKSIKIDIPDTLEVIILLFIFCAEILGEIREYYITFEYWDTMLHTVNGFLMGAIGFSLIDILNRNKKFTIEMSPLFVAMVAFCFSMTIGMIWEFYEYGMDKFFMTDMQKDTYVSQVSSVELNENGKNSPKVVDIENVRINGEEWQGYLDVGLTDTMQDLFVNFIGAAVFSIIGYFYIKRRANIGVIRRLTLVYKKD